MTDRGKRHRWYMTENGPKCQQCGAHGTHETFNTGYEFGWRGKPTYGCKDKTDG